MTLSALPDRHVGVAGTYNFRDLGGLPIADGYRVRPGQVFRSDALDSLGPAGRADLSRLGIVRVIDLRNDRERDLNPNDLTGTGIESIHVPLIDELAPDEQLRALDGAEPGHQLRSLYAFLVTRRASRITAALQAVAEAPGPCVIHCTAGKDRTGVVCGVLLSALGVPDDITASDYALSEQCLDGPWADAMLSLIAAHGLARDPALVHTITASPAAYMREVLDLIGTIAPSTGAWLLANGLTADALAALRQTLISTTTEEQPHDQQ